MDNLMYRAKEMIHRTKFKCIGYCFLFELLVLVLVSFSPSAELPPRSYRFQTFSAQKAEINLQLENLQNNIYMLPTKGRNTFADCQDVLPSTRSVDKVDKCSRIEETRQRNNLLKDKSEKCNISNTTDSKNLSPLQCTNTAKIETRRDLRINRQEIHCNGGDKISKIHYSSEVIKDANFEYEEEWDIGGIPELLSELDADIEKSITNIQASKFDGIKNASNNKQNIPKLLRQKRCEKELVSNNLNDHKNTYSSKISKNKTLIDNNISASTFTGFSKRGHLISNFSNSIPVENIGQQVRSTKNLEEQGCRVSMSSQAGNNGNTSGNVGGTSINITCSQGVSGSNNSGKTNNKMSIDHQATLDKGLKMKIKRTKPGTKSSEAKHEIVKATEQQQNGLLGSGTSVCSTSQEDVPCLLLNQSTSSNSQSSNVTLGTNNVQCNLNLTGNKKILGSGNNQNNVSSNSGSICLNTANSSTNSISQSLSQGSKRGSSGHRRDKAKDKSSHSIRTGIEKNVLVTNEKESIERPLCHCITMDGNATTCSNGSCIRKTENVLTQRLPAKNTCGNISIIPPGVFTPSTDTSTSAVVSNLLTVTTAISTNVCTQTVSSGANSNTLGPPSKEVSTNNGGNVKISSHIAAQLAAVASNSSSNGSCITSASFPNTELKSSSSNLQSQIVKLLSPSPNSSSATLPVPVSNQNASSVSSTTGMEKLINISNLKSEDSESPPAKRLKHSDNNSTMTAINKEMVDMCIGTSIGTITEPDCLGPCEPGTSVTLEGIVWHETEGGVLVVNVTWRGKTYVGTLLDCTRHDWAPPRFCDSPTDDLDVRTPKGRGKRGRATITPDLSNFTETRSSIYFSHSHVHSKLRNGSTKGGRGTARTTNVPSGDKANNGTSLSSGNNGSTPRTSPIGFLPPRAEKRKSKDESPPPVSADNEAVNSGTINTTGIPVSGAVSGLASQPQSLINPVTGLNVQINTKKCKTSSPCAISPVLLECPENDCSKKYKHVNGLRYHQSHAHGSTSLHDEDSMAETEEHITPQPSPVSSTPTPSLTPNPSDFIPNNQTAISSQPVAAPITEESNTTKIIEEDVSRQLENSEHKFSSEKRSPLSCEDMLTSTLSDSTTPVVTCASENTQTGTTQQDQRKQFLDLVENNKIAVNSVLSLESNTQATGKSGVLRFGQGESKNNNGSCLLPTCSPNDILLQPESLEAGSPKKFLPGQQESSNDTFCPESMEKSSLQNQTQQHSIATNKSSVTPVVTKPKKERKSPSITDYDTVKINPCNISSREDVLSPAYSDISDDSTPVNESEHIGKADVSKNSDITTKPQDIGLSVSTGCPSTQTNLSSTLSSYGVYQFYQQQQFIVPSASEQQQPAKNTLNANIGPSLAQQQCVPEFNSKKDPPLDVISKVNSNQPHSNQHCQDLNKDTTGTICVSGDQGNSELPSVQSVGSSALNSTSKAVSHFYAFNYMPSNYSFNVDHNFGSSGSVTTSDDNAKPNRLPEISSPNGQSQQLHAPILYKEDRSKEEICSTDTAKSANLQISSKQSMKSDSMAKSECIKQESSFNAVSQISQHMQTQSKDHQGVGVYTNMYQRHPLALASPQLSREEELRRYYIFSDQQRRHNSSSHNVNNQPTHSTIPQSGNQQCKDIMASSQQHAVHNQQQIKIKGNTSLNLSKSANSANTSKESPKHKQEEELKVIKQEGQKPTMETQGPPPPPTSQYFLHPSYITSTPFGFDPSHPMYRNVLMPATSPYNAPPYHMPMPRYHAPEDLSRNTGTKALDALHHAASQYYTTHKIHELSERALKSPNNSNSSNVSGAIKITSSNPNIGTAQHSNIGSNIIAHHSVQNQSSSATQLPHNLASQTISIANKQDIAGQKSHGNGPGVTGTPSESQKPQMTVNSSTASGCNSGNGSGNNANNINSGSTSDSRSPPPQRHVHTHHHTHVGLGYPMYPAPYGAAVLASQQAAAVAVINPFPPGPSK